MSLARFYIDENLSIGSEQLLPETVAHHLKTVLRKQMDDEIILFNGQGGEYKSRICKIDKKQVFIEVLSFQDIERESPLSITLAQGISKGQRMDITLQKAVELGVSRIVPIRNQRSTVQLKEDRKASRMNHWRQVIISACEQSGRNRIPELLSPCSLDEWLEQDSNAHKLLLAPEGEKSLRALEINDKTPYISLLTGSEGGLTDGEINQACDSGYAAVKMGPRVFRTETAALVAISVCQSLWGDLI